MDRSSNEIAWKAIQRLRQVRMYHADSQFAGNLAIILARMRRQDDSSAQCQLLRGAVSADQHV
jgi:hypothetical protein